MGEHAIAFGGPAGVVKWGYYPAASLRDWSVKALVLTATITEKDDTRLSQQPLSFVVARPSTTWTWPIESLRVEGQTLTASLRPQE